jgi:hypothetical protein
MLIFGCKFVNNMNCRENSAIRVMEKEEDKRQIVRWHTRTDKTGGSAEHLTGLSSTTKDDQMHNTD